MDLSITVQDTRVNIRVAGLIKTAKGYIFEKSEKGYVFMLGGRVKLGESTHEAIVREIKEEIGMDSGNLTLRSVIENFYTNNNEKVQEICFVYEINEVFTGIVPSEFVEVQIDDFKNYDIKPALIVEILKGERDSFKHIVVK